MKTCKYWNCNKRIRAGHFLCLKHYEAYEDEDIDKCPKCGNYKDADYNLCLECKITPKSNIGYRNAKVVKDKKSFRLEHSKAWEKRDKEADSFYVYILKDTRGTFYVGQTRDLRARLSEHKDGKTKSTAGRRSELQYYEEHKSRNSAAVREVELKKLVARDERQIRKMIIEYQDRVRLVKLG